MSSLLRLVKDLIFEEDNIQWHTAVMVSTNGAQDVEEREEYWMADTKDDRIVYWLQSDGLRSNFYYFDKQ